MKRLLALAACLCALPCFGAPLSVFVANYPLKYFAERIGGTHVVVSLPAPKDQDPAFWQPSDKEVEDYQKAGLILMNGATFSKWAEKTTLPRTKTVDTSAAFKDKFITIANAVTHSHGPAGTHSHDGISFTTWIDFQQGIAQAQAVRDALTKRIPDAKTEFEASFITLKTDLESLDARLVELGKNLAGQPLVASHPVYHYFARRYALNLKDVLWEPEDVPTDAQMNDLQKILSSHPAKWMIWEGEPAKDSVAKLSALGIKSVVFDPCSNRPSQGDFLAVMKANVTSVERMASK